MGRVCLICGQSRPSESFGGRGSRAVICAECRRISKDEKQRILALEEVYGFLLQKNISAKNIKRLSKLEAIEDLEFRELRTLVLHIATVHPRKRRRWKFIARQHPDLMARIIDSHFLDELFEEFDWFPAHDWDVTEYEYEDLVGVWLENQEP